MIHKKKNSKLFQKKNWKIFQKFKNYFIKSKHFQYWLWQKQIKRSKGNRKPLILFTKKKISNIFQKLIFGSKINFLFKIFFFLNLYIQAKLLLKFRIKQNKATYNLIHFCDSNNRNYPSYYTYYVIVKNKNGRQTTNFCLIWKKIYVHLHCT